MAWARESPISVTMAFVLLFMAPTQCSSRWEATCPEKCICELRKSSTYQTVQRVLDCSNRKLKAFPKSMPEDTQVLILRRNAITSIPAHLHEQMTELKEIDLSHNQITVLQPATLFENLTNLHSINLQYNHISKLPSGIFNDLPQLNKLLLGYNHGVQIPEDIFANLTRLDTLSLDGNNIEMINPGWFYGLRKLVDLSAQGNNIRTLGDRTFQSLISLLKLSLANNNISQMSKYAFKGLEQLQYLVLDGNQLTQIPSMSLSGFKSLKTISMNRNPVGELQPGNFDKTLVSEINLSDMPALRSINQYAFNNIQKLTRLRIHDNPHLTFIDPKAFVNLSNLEVLNLHNNDLLALPGDILVEMPNIKKISLYNNPLRCDCNARWLKIQLLGNFTDENITIKQDLQLEFPELGKLKCTAPPTLSGQYIEDVSLSHFPSTCPPTAIPFFEDNYQREQGHSVSFECRAIGVPQPHIHWILANRKPVNNTSNYSQIKLDSLGTLSILSVKPKDAGPYTCVATNQYGFDTVSSLLQVHSKNIHILHKGVATNFITVTWNGTSSTVTSSDYVVLYRKANTEDEYKKIHIKPYMRAYTITKLKPRTEYEFCIGYMHKSQAVPIHCTEIITKHELYVVQGIYSLTDISVVIALCVTFLFLFFSCLVAVMCKKYQQRKLYSNPESSEYKIGAMSQIPLDNLYNPPSTPLCNSRTSLIGPEGGGTFGSQA